MKAKTIAIYMFSILLFIYGTIVKIKSPASQFFIFWILLAALLIFYNKKKFKLNPITRKLIFSSSLIFLVFFIVIQVQILMSFKTRAEENLDYIIILGTEIIGNQPSQNLKLRLDKGIEYLNQNPKTKVIVTGGRVSNPDYSEAEVMAKYLLKNAIDPSKIIMEQKSTRTIENMNFSKVLMEYDWKHEGSMGIRQESKKSPSYAILTNNFHMKRALVIAKKLGLNQVQSISASSDRILLVNSLTREFFAFIKYWILD